MLKTLSADEAVQLVRDLVVAEVEVMKKLGSRGEKGAQNREHKAAAKLFKALTGEGPNAEQVLEMTEY